MRKSIISLSGKFVCIVAIMQAVDAPPPLGKCAIIHRPNHTRRVAVRWKSRQSAKCQQLAEMRLSRRPATMMQPFATTPKSNAKRLPGRRANEQRPLESPLRLTSLQSNHLFLFKKKKKKTRGIYHQQRKLHCVLGACAIASTLLR